MIPSVTNKFQPLVCMKEVGGKDIEVQGSAGPAPAPGPLWADDPPRRVVHIISDINTATAAAGRHTNTKIGRSTTFHLQRWQPGRAWVENLS